MEDAINLKTYFSKEEGRNAINDLGKEKSWGLYGFNIAFFQHCWDIVKGDMMGFSTNFHTRGIFQISLNATFLSLVPKIARVYGIMKFGLISLVGSV